MKKILFLACALVSTVGFSQNSSKPYEWPSHRNWFMGTPTTGSQIVDMNSMKVTDLAYPVTVYEGTSAASDDNGNLLFYTNGRQVWNAAGVLTTSALLTGNEGGASGNSSSASQGVIIVRHPLNAEVYHVFTTDDAIQNPTLGLNHFTLNKNGELLSGPNRLGSFRTTEGIAATSHANGVDIWVTVQESASTNFHTYLLNCEGLEQTSVISSVAVNLSGQGLRGGLAFSNDGSKFVATHAAEEWASPNIKICTFNNITGMISGAIGLSPQEVRATDAPYDVLFSPDDSKIYFSSATGRIIYYDVTSMNASSIINSRKEIAGNSSYCAIEIGPDGNLYQGDGNNGGKLQKISGNLNTGGPFTRTSIVGTSMFRGLPTMYLPPAEEPNIQQVGPLCDTTSSIDLSTTWSVNGLNAEDPSAFPNAYHGTGVTDAGTGLFNPKIAGIGTHQIVFTRCGVDDTISVVVVGCKNCINTITQDTTLYFVDDVKFSSKSPKLILESTIARQSVGGCDSVVNYYSNFVYNATYCSDTTYVQDTTTITNTVLDTITTNVVDTTNVTIMDTITVTNTVVDTITTHITVTDTNYVTKTNYVDVYDSLIVDLTGVITAIDAPFNSTLQVRVYPNPASQLLFLEVLDTQVTSAYSFELINVNGSIVADGLLNSNTTTVDISSYTGGTYYVKFYDAQGKMVNQAPIVIRK